MNEGYNPENKNDPKNIFLKYINENKGKPINLQATEAEEVKKQMELGAKSGYAVSARPREKTESKESSAREKLEKEESKLSKAMELATYIVTELRAFGFEIPKENNLSLKNLKVELPEERRKIILENIQKLIEILDDYKFDLDISIIELLGNITKEHDDRMVKLFNLKESK
jgi:hypothetical protein